MMNHSKSVPNLQLSHPEHFEDDWESMMQKIRGNDHQQHEIKIITKDTSSKNWMKRRKSRRLSKHKKRPKIKKRRHSLPLCVAGISPIHASAQKFKDLLLFEKTLSKPLFTKLREIFKVIDADNNGRISADEVIKIDILLCPKDKLKSIENDAQIFFSLATRDNFNMYSLSEHQWLKGWSDRIKNNGYDLELLENFVNGFYEMKDKTNMEQIVSSETTQNMDNGVFSGLQKWKHKAIKRVSLRHYAEEYAKRRKEQKTELQRQQQLKAKTIKAWF